MSGARRPFRPLLAAYVAAVQTAYVSPVMLGAAADTSKGIGIETIETFGSRGTRYWCAMVARAHSTTRVRLGSSIGSAKRRVCAT